MAEKKPLRERIAEAGGLYMWVNTNIVRIAGPAAVGPYETEPEPDRTVRPCPLCGSAVADHTFDRSGPKPLMHCPKK